MRGLILLAALAVAFTGAVAADEPATTDVVHLAFGWTPGTVAQVETTRQRTRATGDKESTMSASARYRMRVEHHAEGLTVSYSDFETPAIAGSDAERVATAESILQQLSTLSPSIVVSPDAQLLRLEHLQELQSRMQATLEPLLATMKDAPPQLEAMLRTALSEQALTASAAQDWNALVGAWAGAEFEPGAVYALEAVEPLPLLPGTTVPMKYEFSLVEERPCTGEAEGPRCAVLEMRSSPEPEALRKILDDFMRRMTQGSKTPAGLFERLDVRSTVVVTLEPAGMRPHRLEIEKRIEGVVSAPGEASQAVSQVDGQVSTFSYLD